MTGGKINMCPFSSRTAHTHTHTHTHTRTHDSLPYLLHLSASYQFTAQSHLRYRLDPRPLNLRSVNLIFV